MDTLVSCFRRREGMTTDAFGEYYLHNHAPLAMASVPTLAGYRVNLVARDLAGAGTGPEPDGGYDAVTIIDTPSAAAFFGGRAYDDVETAARMTADHDAFIGHMDAYQVELAPPVTVPATPGEAAPGAKLLLLCRDPAAADKGRWPELDLSGVEAVMLGVRRAWTPQAPPLAAVVELRGADAETLAAAAAELGDRVERLPVTEYLFRRVE